MRKLQTQGVHHITLTGADRQTSIEFWEGARDARAEQSLIDQETLIFT